MKVTMIFYVKNKIEIDVIGRLIIKFQSFSDDWPTSECKNCILNYISLVNKALLKIFLVCTLQPFILKMFLHFDYNVYGYLDC